MPAPSGVRIDLGCVVTLWRRSDDPATYAPLSFFCVICLLLGADMSPEGINACLKGAGHFEASRMRPVARVGTRVVRVHPQFAFLTAVRVSYSSSRFLQQGHHSSRG